MSYFPYELSVLVALFTYMSARPRAIEFTGRDVPLGADRKAVAVPCGFS